MFVKRLEGSPTRFARLLREISQLASGSFFLVAHLENHNEINLFEKAKSQNLKSHGQ